MKLRKWLNCEKDLLKIFSVEELEKALKESRLTEEDLTDVKDCENGCYYKPNKLIKPIHTSNTITVYKTVRVDGQFVSMEGYKSGSVETYRIPARYQGLKHERLIRKLLENKFEWFNKFKWEIYELSGLEHYEIYLKTSEKHKSFKTKLSLYVPLVALIKKDIEAIKKRNVGYWGFYTNSSYNLNKKNGETLKKFQERKERENKEYLEVFNTKETIELFGLLK